MMLVLFPLLGVDILTVIFQVLAYCNASPKEYKCIFTSGATAALKLVGETFPWSTNSIYSYTMENHNSVLGIREYPFDHIFNKSYRKAVLAINFDLRNIPL
jgi:hypothetical protein